MRNDDLTGTYLLHTHTAYAHGGHFEQLHYLVHATCGHMPCCCWPAGPAEQIIEPGRRQNTRMRKQRDWIPRTLPNFFAADAPDLPECMAWQKAPRPCQNRLLPPQLVPSREARAMAMVVGPLMTRREMCPSLQPPRRPAQGIKRRRTTPPPVRWSGPWQRRTPRRHRHLLQVRATEHRALPVPTIPTSCSAATVPAARLRRLPR
jgi:hypothetical protein